MGLIEWYKKVVLKHYADFTGRARRQEYWMFVLANMIVAIGLSVIDMIIGFQIFSGLYSLAVLIPSLAVGARRLHDIGKSGWWLLISLIPLVGAIWLLVLLAQDGTPEPNQWGASPKYGVQEEIDKFEQL